jgi:hypothetical protein
MTPAPSGASARPRGKRRWPVREVVVISAITTLRLEVVLHAATTTGENGMDVIGRVALLPFRPSPAVLETFFKRARDPAYMVPDQELGWSVAKRGRYPDFGPVLYQSNDQAARTDKDHVYGPTAGPGVTRIVTVGDSFTHCDEVHNHETWQHALESMHPNLEVINLGGPGYGTDQAVLRFKRDGRQFRPQVALLGIWAEDMCRNLNVIRYFLTPSSGFGSKPRFVARGGEVSLVNSPLMSKAKLRAALSRPEAEPLLAHEGWYDPAETRESLLYASQLYRVTRSVMVALDRKQRRERMYTGELPQAIEATVAIAREFARLARESGALPIVLVIPMREHIALHLGDEPFPLTSALEAAGLDVVDLGTTFGKRLLDGGLDRFYMPKGHHTPEANRMIAEALATELQPYLQRVEADAPETAVEPVPH